MREYPYEFKKDDAFRFAREIGAKTKVNGKELQFTYCPYCRGGRSHDKDTFAISLENGTWNCKRDGCGRTGNMLILAKDFDFSLGTEYDAYYKPRKTYRQFKTPKEPITPKPAAVQYLESRGISEQIVKQYEITTWDNNEKVLVFPFYDEDGKLVFIKYRKTDFNKERDKNKEWSETNGKPILFGMKQCTKGKTLIITEGQIDSLSVAEAGYTYAVSVPTGAKGTTWIPNCWDWVNTFQKIIVFGDHENGHITLLDDISKRFSLRIFHVQPEDYRDCKDANEILRKYGKEQIVKCIENATQIPVRDVVELADVPEIDIYALEKCRTSIRQLDKLLYGGLPFGGVHLVTGKAGEGKLLADDTPVFTKNGWKNHGDLVVGDEVIGRYGEFVKVTHVFPKGYANMKVTLNNNEILYCHENHEWVTDLHSGNGYKEGIQTTLEIKEYINRVKTHPARLIAREPLIGTKKKLHVKPYTLGAWLGDGRNNNPDICSSWLDYCVIDRVLKDGYVVSWQTIQANTNVIYTGFKGLRKQLQKYGMCHSRKRVDKFIPHDYLIAPINVRLELLAGLLDTDGYYDKTKHGYTYATSEESLRDSVIDLIHTFGWNCWCRTVKPKVSTSGIVGKKNTYMICFVPIGLKIPCEILRKRQDIIKPYSKRRTSIRSVEYCKHKQGNCIEVDGGVYCVGKTMIPTHNSTLASQILISAREQGYKCFAYSGELPNTIFKSWMNFQVAGRKHIFEYQDNPYGDIGYNISQTNKALIADWYRHYVYIYDNSAIDGVETSSLLKITEKVIQQYGVRVILMDNLMTAMTLDNSKGSDQYERQTEFVNQLRSLAVKYNVMIILVAHKRKNGYGGNENDEVAGSSNIVNLAMVTIAYERDKDCEESQRLLKVSKNRLFGRTDTEGYVLNFNERSKRIYGDGDDLDVEYSWSPDSDGFVDADDVVFD